MSQMFREHARLLSPALTSSLRDLCIHQLFEAQVERTPHNMAVTFDDTHVTYAELNGRANGLARRLCQMGAGPDVPVGLFLDRSIDMVVGILAILKAGAAYVPLDPDYPDDHLAVIVDDARITAIVAETSLMSRVFRMSRRPVSLVPIDAVGKNDSEGNPTEMARPDDLAYVMYTSGSTGRPKGVMITHRNVVHSTDARLAFYREPVETFLLLPSFAFDASVATIFWTLRTGGCLALPPPGAERDPSSLGRLVARFRATHLLCVSSLYARLIERATADELASVRTVIVGGEPLPPAVVERHRRMAPRARLFNEYGATECTVWSTVCEITGQATEAPRSIGRPIANTQVYILDAAQQPVPSGVEGELYIGGDGVARGYLNHPESTATHFVPHPFRLDGGARLYRTGDLARHLADGTIEFRGRQDRQAKVGGCRIEPGEVEAALTGHPAVETAAVAALDGPPETRLVAYVVARPPARPTATDLKAFLRLKLPAFMVPASVVFVDALPTTATGKVDRQALLRAGQEQRRGVQLERDAAALEPLEPFERQLKEIWEQLLGVRPVGADDNFFELGGNSLAAADLLTRTEALTGRALHLASLLEGPTIRQLARLIRERPDASAPSSALTALRRDGSRPPVFCIHPLGGVCSFAPLVNRLGPDQPVYALRADTLDGNGASPASIEGMASGCLTEMRAVQPEGPYCLAGYSLGGLIAFDVARQLTAAGEGVLLLALFNTFNPAYSPLLSRIEHARERAQYHWKQLWSGSRRFAYVRQAAWRAALRGFVKGRPRLSTARCDQTGGLTRALHAAHDANSHIGMRYVPRPYAGRLTLFRATGTGHVFPSDALLGWKNLVGDIRVHDVAGDHWSMLGEPHVRVLAEQLTACLDRSRDLSRDGGTRPGVRARPRDSS